MNHLPQCHPLFASDDTSTWLRIRLLRDLFFFLMVLMGPVTCPKLDCPAAFLGLATGPFFENICAVQHDTAPRFLFFFSPSMARKKKIYVFFPDYNYKINSSSVLSGFTWFAFCLCFFLVHTSIYKKMDFVPVLWFVEEYTKEKEHDRIGILFR